MDDGREKFLIYCAGGPLDGFRHFSDGHYGLTWPMPAEIPTEHGRYIKTFEMELPPQPPGGHVARGARYEWKAETEDE